VRHRLEQDGVRLLLGQPRNDADDDGFFRNLQIAPHLVPRPRRHELAPVHGVVNDLDLPWVGVHLLDIEVPHRLRGCHDGVRAFQQKPFGQGMMRLLVRVDVHLSTDNDRHSGEHRSETPVQTRGQQKRVNDGRAHTRQVTTNRHNVERPAPPGLDAQYLERHAGSPDLLADGTGMVNTPHRWFEPRRQVPYQVQHHLLRASDHERV
jgi:hypothetical protein